MIAVASLVALIVYLLALLAGLVALDRRRRSRNLRMERARAGTARPEAGASAAMSPSRTAAPELQRRLSDRLARQLRRAGLRTTATEAAVQGALLALAVYALAALVLRVSPLLALAAALAAPVGLGVLILRAARARYVAAFTANLPEALDIFARGLRAGRPVADSLGIVVDNVTGPVGIEFTRCRDEMRMGAGLSQTLNRLSQSMPTPEVGFFAVSTALQAETGGNLVETMDTLASQLRDRRQLRRKARALSSEARASAIILASLPFAVAGLLMILNPSYLAPLAFDPRGKVMTLVAVTSIGAGIWMMVRMGKLNV